MINIERYLNSIHLSMFKYRSVQVSGNYRLNMVFYMYIYTHVNICNYDSVTYLFIDEP